jgi:5S rRNA maturation endonuclease (ribonuclease M5)
MPAPLKTRTANQPPQLEGLSREQVRKRFTIPSPFFVKRGFSPEVLDNFDVGHSRDFNREIVPCYDETRDKCIGSTFRSIKRMCDVCRKYHDRWVDCKWGQGKWGISFGFPKRNFVYNLGNAKKSGSPNIFLVEGAPDVWRLTEAGHIAVAVLGSDVTDDQLAKLQSLRKTILVAFDNDKAGRSGWDHLQSKLASCRTASNFVRFTIPEECKDLGDISARQLRKVIDDFLNRSDEGRA